MKMKIWFWSYFIITILIGICFLYIDISYYASVIDTSIFIIGLAGQIFLGIYSVIRKTKTFIYGGLFMIVLSIIVFIIAIPDYSYQEAEQTVIDKYKANQAQPFLLDHKTVPTNESTWNVGNKAYYIAIDNGETQKQIDYYLVDPNEGIPIKLDEPYW